MGQNRIMILGDALSEKDVEEGRPFAGASGWFLDQLLSQVGLRRDDCFLTNVFNLRPPSNMAENLCGLPAVPGYPRMSNKKYIRAEFLPELLRLEQEIKTFQPTLILAMGSAAAWFTLSDGRVGKIRGSATIGRHGIKVLPTYHPGAVLRDYSLRPILTADLYKAERESHFPELRRPRRFIHIEPNFADIKNFYNEFIAPSSDLSVDIETIANQITCVGLAPSATRALVIPFYDPSKAGNNYWPDLESEVQVWRWLKLLFRERKKNIGQNFIYDAGFFWRSYGIPVWGMDGGDDTMLMHHAFQPELQKGLAFLGSIYTDEAPWKLERKNDSVKKED